MQKMIIDTDCGVDDAVAILMAVQHPEVEIVGISTVNGNVGVSQSTDNVLRLLNYVERNDIPVFRGATAPLVEPVQDASSVHGKNGLADIQLAPAPRNADGRRAPEGLRDLIASNPGVTLVTLGPLTNLALLGNLYPQTLPAIGSVVSMGGAFEEGNVTQFAEFNYFADPEAVQFVVNRDVPLTVVTWDACRSAVLSEAELTALGIPGTPVGDLVDRLQRFGIAIRERLSGSRSTLQADAVAMAVAIDPAVVQRQQQTGLVMELNRTTRRGASVKMHGDRLTAILDVDKARYAQMLSQVR